MDLLIYLDKRIRIVIDNGYYYIGKVIDANKNDLTLIDKLGKNVTLKKELITRIQEVDGW